MISIAVDGMGGDHAPAEIVKGAISAIREYSVKIILFGSEKALLDHCSSPEAKSFIEKGLLEIQEAPESIGMSESPSVAFRKKKNSSIHLGLEWVRDKKADGFVSAGNTGAVLAVSTFILGRIDHVERPTLAAIIPSQFGPFIMCDVGSNVDCKPRHLAQFAIMANHFARLVLKINTPRLGLLNIGEEEDKGNTAALEAYQMIKTLPLNFVGNMEGKDIMLGKSDVIICDGFVGNCLLKFGEGVEAMFGSFFKAEAKSSLRSLLGLLILKPSFMKFKKNFDYAEYGGAPLLGVNGVSVVAHGKSKERAIKNAIRMAIETVKSDMVSEIANNISTTFESLQKEPVS
jgi:phosphate acyltransferase